MPATLCQLDFPILSSLLPQVDLVYKLSIMKPDTSLYNRILKFSMISLCVFLLAGATNPTLAQKKYKHTKEQYRRKATTEFIIGGILIVGGTIGTLNYQHPKPGVYLSNANSSSDWMDVEIDLSMNLWPVAIVGGSVVSLIGLNHLIKSNRVTPLVEIQKIPGLDHIGIVYPKYPTIGIKYSL
jgi:hypothetical protein